MDFRPFMTGAPQQKLLGIVLSVAIVMLLLWLFTVSRIEFTSIQSAEPPSQERRESVREMMGTAKNENVAEQRSSRLFMNAFTTFVVMMALFAGVWIWSRNRSRFAPQHSAFKELGDQMIGPNQQIKVIEINEEVWVLGLASGSIVLLHRYAKEDWKGTEQASKADPKRRFMDILSGKS